MTWDYDDYVQQVSRGMRPNMYGGLGSRIAGSSTYLQASQSHENDLRYEEKVDAFLRGIGSRPKVGGHDHHYSRSRSRSCSYSPPPPHPHSRRHEYYRGSSSYSRSRSPSGPNVLVSKVRRGEVDPEVCRQRPTSQYLSPRRRDHSGSRSRSPASFGREPPTQWRRPSQTSVAHSSGSRQRHQQVETRVASHQTRSPRVIASGGSRTYVSSSRHHK
ncbi:YTH domain-containing protein 1 [Schistosoma japonicum]|nr:YTH domain-containing protein 1 [Schistosoma japonicum]KAH8868453.1 YTH domain-containing protein 1 [Schistosoma japonicum]